MRSPLSSAFLCLALVACAQPPPGTPAEETPVPVRTNSAASAADHKLYDIVASESLLLIQVMRSGPLSRFGHNHVIGGSVISGQLSLASNLSKDLPDSRINLNIDLDALQIDKPQWRLDAGEDFASVPSEDDIAETRTNMLGPKVLDTERFPDATMEVTGILGSAPDFSVLARITLKDSTRSLPIPVHIETSGQRISATGSFVLTQSDFGIDPFSILLGAISVKDDLQIHYTIVAAAAP